MGGVWLSGNLKGVPLYACTVISMELLLREADQRAPSPICLDTFNESVLAANPTSTSEQANKLVEVYGHLIQNKLAIRN